MAGLDAYYETGEDFLDNETGETRQIVICLRSERLFTNAETGEPEIEKNNTPRKKSSFQVPKSLLEDRLRVVRQSQRCDEIMDVSCIKERKLEINCIERNMVCGTQNVSPVVFMLPTLLFFPAWASILCVLCEAAIHIWSHKRNKLKKNNRMFYRSPLHLITSEFCAHCRTYKLMQKVSKIQDKRSLRRKLMHPDVIKGVVR